MQCRMPSSSAPTALCLRPSLRDVRVRARAPKAAEFSNPIGAHALVFAGDWTQPSAERAVSGAAAAGYQLVEIATFDVPNLDPAITKRVFAQHGLQPACSLGLTLDADISSEDAEVVAKGAADLDAALTFAAAIGSQHLCGILYSALAKYTRPPTPQGRKNCARELRQLATKAEDLGIKVCLEVVNRYETNLLNTAGQAMDFITSDVQHQNVFVHLDSYHMHIEESGFEAAVTLCGDRLGYVHIGESHRGYLGTGSVDFVSLFRGLASIDYKGPITFESFSSEVVNPELSNTLCVWRNMWSDSDNLAREARAFIEQQWQAARITTFQTKYSTPGV